MLNPPEKINLGAFLFSFLLISVCLGTPSHGLMNAACLPALPFLKKEKKTDCFLVFSNFFLLIFFFFVGTFLFLTLATVRSLLKLFYVVFCQNSQILNCSCACDERKAEDNFVFGFVIFLTFPFNFNINV